MNKGGRTAEAVGKPDGLSTQIAPQHVSSHHDRLLHLQRNAGNHVITSLFRSGQIRAKLTVSQPGDPYEQEADRVAEQVMRMAAPSPPSPSPSLPRIQRKCSACAGGGKCSKCEEEERIHRKVQTGSSPASPGAGTHASGVVPSSFLNGLGPGRPLDTPLRGMLEPRFGHDFGDVRIHTDSTAARSAGQINALAYTFGHDIAFAPGRFDPSSPSGLRLLSHELTHVLQQRSGVSRAIQRQKNDENVHSTPFGGTTTSGPPGVPYEKWSPDVETMYRRAGLVEAAEAVARCRQGDCSMVLTEEEGYEAYRNGRVSAGLEKPAPKTQATPQSSGRSAAAPPVAMAAALPLAGAAAQTATSAAAKTAAERAALRWGLAGAAEEAAVAAPAAAAAPLAGGAAETATGTAVKTAAERAALRWGLAGAAEEAAVAAPAAAAAPGAAIATVAVPVALGIYVIVGVVDLVRYGNFQTKLHKLGYVILPHPLQVCISGCHQPAAPTFKPLPNFPSFPRGPLIPRTKPIDEDELRKFIEQLPTEGRKPQQPGPQPTPQPIPAPQPAPPPKSNKCTDEEVERLHDKLKKVCNQQRSCSMQGDTCASATLKVAAGYACIAAREEMQRKCFGPGDPGYEGHMQQIAQAYAALRGCLEVMQAKCK